MTKAGADSDEALMVRYAQGDTAAFRTLFERYHPILVRMMRRRGAKESEASDLVQQTFLQLHRARNDYNPEHPLRPYLVTIALNTHRAYLRRAGRHPEEAVHLGEPVEPADDRERIDPLERRQEAERVRRALSQLPDSQRVVIEMHWFEELPFKDIANAVGASLSAVKVRACRGYGKLREILEKDPEVAS